jgi:hypothetical protein
MILTTISWGLAKCSCPSWSSSTAESALRSSLASLEDCSSSSHWWLELWTFLVALGVALEVVFILWEYLGELGDFRSGVIRPPERPNTILFALGLLGAGLVAAGVSGELWEESRIATTETCLRRGNDMLFLLLSKEAGSAAASAEKARQDAEAIREQLSDTSRIAAEARLKLGEYVDTVAERQFNRRLDSRKFVELLKGKPKARVEVLYNPNDLEAWDLALDIHEWLGKGPSKADVAAGWDVAPPEPIPPNVNAYGLANAPPAVRLGASGSQSGISFIVKNISAGEERDSPLASLSNALVASILPSHRGTSWMSTEDKSLPDDLIIVVVGPKPSWLWGLQKWTEQKKETSPKKK